MLAAEAEDEAKVSDGDNEELIAEEVEPVRALPTPILPTQKAIDPMVVDGFLCW